MTKTQQHQRQRQALQAAHARLRKAGGWSEDGRRPTFLPENLCPAADHLAVAVEAHRAGQSVKASQHLAVARRKLTEAGA